MPGKPGHGLKLFRTNALKEDLVKSASEAGRLSVSELFETFASSAEFKTALWQKRPFLLTESLGNIKGAYTMAEVQMAVDNDFIEAGRGTPIPGGGWNMATVSEPRGSSFQDAKLRFQDVEMAMKQTSGTVVFNSAGGFIPPLAGVCLQTIEAFDLPSALNMYLTNPGQKVSAPPHTDRQDVFVLQTQGQKRWRVFQPPPPSARALADPFARGKGKDELAEAELTMPPLIDTVLSPGHVLYVPAGYPHTTDTIHGIEDTSAPSVHLTVGLDTHVWGLSFAGLRSYALRRKGKAHQLNVAKVDSASYWQLQQSLPLGFLASDSGSGSDSDSDSDSGKEETAKLLVAALIPRMRAAEPLRWADQPDDAALALALGAHETALRMLDHHRTVTDLLGRMYADVALKLTPAKFDLSFFRSQPYFQQLEATMTQLESWADGSPSGDGGTGGFGKQKTVAPNLNKTKSKASDGAAKSAKRGFG